MKVLTFSTLYPNAATPHHGVFVENRLRQLVATGQVETRVVAPVPWFPFTAARFGDYARFARAPAREVRHGIAVEHPRYLLLPKVGMTLAPFALFLGALPAVRRALANGFDFDLIDAHYFYPDGVAAVLLARHFGRPVTITARGTDINLIPRYAAPRRLIRWAAHHAHGLGAVCQALKDEMVGLGMPEAKVRVLRNGVDLALFRPGDRVAARHKLGVDGPVVASVGHLIDRKGHDLVIDAMAELPDATLLIAGEGPDRAALESLSARLGVAGRVRFLGRIVHEELPDLYRAADALVLASSREGWANVLLEAMACGTPVVASNVWGTPEVVAAPEAGRLLPERSAAAIAAGVRALLADPPSRAATRAYAERFGWEPTTQGQLDQFRDILVPHGQRVAA
ncbi:MAG: glycosyltransferase family 4 protein [Rhodospirillales bacterium]